MPLLITVRHGQSTWNLENRFTGWEDVPLSPQGEAEAHRAGKLLQNYLIHEAYTSVLKRAIDTLEIILREVEKINIPIVKSAALNERFYGDLQGLNKSETEVKYGKDQVNLWRRSYEIAPPGGESLKQTYERVVPYYISEIVPKLKNGRNILIVAHGNSLRALAMYLERITPEEISNVNIATGVPHIDEFDDSLHLVKASYI